MSSINLRHWQRAPCGYVRYSFRYLIRAPCRAPIAVPEELDRLGRRASAGSGKETFAFTVTRTDSWATRLRSTSAWLSSWLSWVVDWLCSLHPLCFTRHARMPAARRHRAHCWTRDKSWSIRPRRPRGKEKCAPDVRGGRRGARTRPVRRRHRRRLRGRRSHRRTAFLVKGMWPPSI